MPLSTINTANFDESSDSPSLARSDLLQLVQAVNQLIGEPRLAFTLEPIVVPVDIFGVLNYATANTTVQIIRAGEVETGAWTLSKVDTGVTSALTGANLVVTNLATETGYVTVTATRSGFNALTKRLLVTRNISSAAPSVVDNTPPPTPTNFVALPGISNILMSWDAPVYSVGGGNSSTVIYGIVWATGAPAPVFTDPGVKAIDAATGANNFHSYASEPNTRWALWIKFRTFAGVESLSPAPAGNPNGVVVTTGQDVTKLLAILNNNITAAQLNALLNTRIDLIDAPSSTTGSVSQRILTETTNRIAAVNAEVVNRDAAILIETNNRIAAVNNLTSVKNRTFYSGSAPVSDGSYTLQTNDTWFDTANGNRQYRWNGSSWILAADTRIAQSVIDIGNEVTNRSTADTAEINARESLYAAVNATVSNDYKVFNQLATPTGTQIGDIWTWKTGAGVETFSRWNGTAWVDSLANKRAAVYLGAYANFAALPPTNNVIGDLSRTVDTNLVYVWNGTAWVAKASIPATAAAFVEQEKDARASAVSAEASLRSTLATQVRGTYTGSDINSLSQGLLFDEKVARSTADASEVNARTSLYAGLGAAVGTDYRVFNQAGTPTATQVGDVWSWKDPAGAVTFNRWNGTTWVDSTADQSPATYLGVFASLPSGTGKLIGDMVRITLPTNTLYVWAGVNGWVLKTVAKATVWAFVEQEKDARVTAVSSEATSRGLLQTQLTGGYSGTDVTALSSGLIFSERTARSTADASEVAARESLYAAVSGLSGTDYKVFNQLATPTGTQIGDLWTWKTSAGVETFSRWNGSAWIDSVANKRAAVNKGAFANFAALPSTGNVIGDTAVTSDSPVFYVWNGSGWTPIVYPGGIRGSATTVWADRETIARAAADTAEITARTTLATQLRGSYAGTDLNLVTNGLIYDEKTARSSADSAQVQRISDLEAGAQASKRVLSETWDGASPLSKWEVVSGSGPLSVVSSSTAQSGKVLSAGVNATNDQIWIVHRDLIPMVMDLVYKVTVRVRRLAGSGSFYSGLTGVASDGVTYVEITGGPGYGNQHYGVISNVTPGATETTYVSYFKRGTLTSGNASGLGTKVSPQIMHQNVRYVRPLLLMNYPDAPGRMEVTSIELEVINVDAQASETEITTLKATVNDSGSGVVATANKVTSLESTVNNSTSGVAATYALLTTQYSTTATTNTAIANQVGTVSARLNSGGDVSNSIVQVDTKASAKTANFVQGTAPASTGGYTLRVNDTWIDTSNGRVLKYWDGATWQLSDDARIGQQANQITSLQSTVGASGPYEAFVAWDFQGTVDGWSMIGGTLSTSTESLTVQSSSVDPQFYRSGLSIQGSRYDKIRMRVKRTAGSGWEGVAYFDNGAHTYSASFYKQSLTSPAIGVWTLIEWDMESLTVGGTDWVNSTVAGIRFDLGSTAADAFLIDWISVGRRGNPGSYAAVTQEISTRASETGYLGAQYSVRTQITSDGRTVIGGFGIMGTSAPGQGATIDFGVQTDKFWIGPPSTGGGSATSVRPFYVVATSFVDPGTGQTVPAGTYMDAAFIKNVTALWGSFGTLVATSIQATAISASQLTLGSGTVGGVLKSSNYAPGGNGWILNTDGTAEFGSVTIRGNVGWSSLSGTVPSSVANSALSISSAGTLSGGGASGTVTLPGLGVKTYRVVARGNSATGRPVDGGVYDADSSVVTPISGLTPMYGVQKISRSTGVLTNVGVYDTLSSPATQIPLMVTALNSIGNDFIVIVRTHDEPQNNRTLYGLPEAMYRHGASRAIFGSPSFKYRAAYVLIAIGGCGESNGFESYAGSVDSDPNAWCDVAFSVRNGQLIVSGTGSTPKTLTDYGYTGTATLIASAGIRLDGNMATRLSNVGGPWQEQVYSKEAYTGGAVAAATVSGVNFAFGLNSDPLTGPDFSTIDYCIYSSAGATFKIENGVSNAIGVASAAGDQMAVTYDGYKIRYLRNGIELSYTLAPSPNLKLYFDSSFALANEYISNIQFVPMGSSAWSQVGGTGRPEDNATVGATWNSNLNGIPAAAQTSILVNLGADQAGIVTSAGYSDFITNSTASSGVSYRVMGGWTFGLRLDPTLGNKYPFIQGKTYKVFVRAKKVGTVTNMDIGYYNNTTASMAGTGCDLVSGYNTIGGALTTSWKTVQLPDFTPSWNSGNDVFMYMGQGSANGVGNTSNYVEIDWLYFQPVNVEEGATVGAPTGTNVAGVPAATVVTNASNGNSAYTAVTDVTTGLNARLRSNAQNILTGGAGLSVGSLTWNSSGVRTGGYGIGFSAAGIAAYNSSGNPTFTLDATTGDATFAGNLAANTVTETSVSAGAVTSNVSTTVQTSFVNVSDAVSGNTTQYFNSGASLNKTRVGSTVTQTITGKIQIDAKASGISAGQYLLKVRLVQFFWNGVTLSTSPFGGSVATFEIESDYYFSNSRVLRIPFSGINTETNIAYTGIVATKIELDQCAAFNLSTGSWVDIIQNITLIYETTLQELKA